jgi:ABC-type uncharacterized transport system substrate-binding protein
VNPESDPHEWGAGARIEGQVATHRADIVLGERRRRTRPVNRGIRAALTVLALWLGATVSGAQETPAPRDSSGAPWRVALYQGGDYKDYHDSLLAIIEGLMTLGWIERAPLPTGSDGASAPLWRWLSTRARSRYLEFPEDAFYDASWDSGRRIRVRKKLLQRLAAPNPDVQLVIALGTWAGTDLATDAHAVPTTVVSASDPLESGIILGPDDSGLEHLHVHFDPWRYERQVRLFHDAVGFSQLGIVYEDSVAGRSYAAIGQVERVARERGFTIVPCHAESDTARAEDAEREYMACFRRLAVASDAIYVALHGGVTERTIPQMVTLAREQGVPTFSQHGADGAEQGLLMSMAAQGFDAVGLFHARIMARILSGASPRSLPMVFVDEPKLSINVDTARAMGLNLSADVLAGADRLFRSQRR